MSNAGSWSQPRRRMQSGQNMRGWMKIMDNRKINQEDTMELFPNVEAVTAVDVSEIIISGEVKLLMQSYTLALTEKDGIEGFTVTNKTPTTQDIVRLKKYKPEIMAILKARKLEEDTKKAIERNEKLNGDVRYRLNDCSSYGMHNGISEFDIEAIVGEIRKQLGYKGMMFSSEIAKKLNKDASLKTIAFETYQARPLNPSWLPEIKESYPERVENKTAEGFGKIPNQLIREKIIVIISADMEKSNIENAKVDAIFEKAEVTGERQILSSWNCECNDPKEECSLDIVTEYAMPDGTTKTVRNHTW